MRKLLILATMFPLLTGVAAGGANQSNLRFLVLEDHDGKPVRNASVVLHLVDERGKQAKGGYALKTDPEGRAVFNGAPYGNLRVQVLATGFRIFGEDFHISQPEHEFVIKLKRPGDQANMQPNPPPQASPAPAQIEAVKPPSTPPLPTLALSVQPANTQVYVDDVFKGMTSAEGRLVVEGLTPGVHRVRMNLLGYTEAAQTVELKAGETATIEAKLEPAGPKPLALGEIEEALTNGLPPKGITKLVNQYGVDFALTKEIEQRLREKGADSDLLVAIATNKK
jgi:hypothetical protein